MERHPLIPAWTALDRDAILSLLAARLAMPPSICIAADLPASTLLDVLIVRAVRFLLERAEANGGLMLTNGGSLARVEVKALLDGMDWPDFDRAAVLAVNKVPNEEDVLPILFARMLAHEAKLLRRYKGRLLATRSGQELLADRSAPSLFRILLETTFWRTNLAFFDRMPADHWPQTHIGVVLWSLSVVAHDWNDPEDLLVTCTMADAGLAAASDFPGFAMVTRVLRPLTWFGLMERKDVEGDDQPEWRQPMSYRKLPSSTVPYGSRSGRAPRTGRCSDRRPPAAGRPL